MLSRLFFTSKITEKNFLCDFYHLFCFIEIGAVSADSYKYKAGKLLEGSDYCFRVAAENSVGTGAFATTESITAKLPFGNSYIALTYLYLQ